MEKYKNHYLITIRLINQLAEKYKREISKKKQLKQKNKLQKEFLGRTKSIIKKIKNTNKILEEYSKYFRRISNPKDEFTVVLIGVPNSGKTTLLSEITSANPEINSYSFTTKSLNIGYFKKREEIIQVVDSPGLIHLELKDMNIIEKQVIVAIKTLADVIIFVYNQYQDNQIQINILEKIKKENPLPIYVFPAFGGKLNGYPHITKQKILNKEFEKQHI
jgi:nucleolar GTP-binding protein